MESRSSLLETCFTLSVIYTWSTAVHKYTDYHMCMNKFFAGVASHLLKKYTTVQVVGIAEEEVQIFWKGTISSRIIFQN